MFVPYRVDTASRGFPWGTAGVVAANVGVAVLLGFPGSGRVIDSWVLRFGTLNPLTWITSAFVHFDPLHLLFNMVFLVLFGFIVECFLGWRRFLLLYFTLAAVESAFTQVLMLGAHGGGAGGASGVIMALLAISALWAPRNHVTILFVLFPLIRSFEVRVFSFCAFYVGLELLWLALGGFRMSSELLHLIGAGAGVGAGIVMLKQGWVDTEGWDYLSIREHGEPRRAAPVVEGGPATPANPAIVTLVRIRDALRSGDFAAADDAYAAAPAGFRLPRAEMEALAQGLHEGGWNERAVPRLEEYVEAYRDNAMRLRLVAGLLDAGRAGKAQDHLDVLQRAFLTSAQQAEQQALRQRAGELESRGKLELE